MAGTMLRTLLVLLLFLPWHVFTCLVCIVFGRSFGDAFGNFGMRAWSGGLLWLSGVRIQADLSALDPGTTYVFMSNHLSNFDIPVLSVALNRWTARMVAKESLFRIPLFGQAIRRAGHVPIDRSNPRAAMRSIDQAVALAREGVSIVVFPEGTRNPEPEPQALQEFQVGGFVLANLFYLSVSERQQEIGLKKALGATSGAILAQFLAEAVVLTTLGALAGLLMGLGLAQFLARLDILEIKLSWRIFIIALGASAAIGIVFGLKPARRAAGLDPIQALRGT